MTFSSTQIHPEVIASRRKQRRLAAGLLRKAEARGLSRLLVVSAESGAGRSTFLDALVAHAPAVSRVQLQVMRAPDLSSSCPLTQRLSHDSATGRQVNAGSDSDSYQLVLVEGPAIMEGDASLSLSPEWIDALDGAVIVVNARCTKRQLLHATAQWLEDMGVPTVGVVWNEVGLPPVSARLYQRMQRRQSVVSKWFPAWLVRSLRLHALKREG